MQKRIQQLIAISLLLLLSGCEEHVLIPSHSVPVGNEDIPAYRLDDRTDLKAEDFLLTTLPDGHDYWIYRKTNSDRGLAAMAHSPECKKCQNRTVR